MSAIAAKGGMSLSNNFIVRFEGAPYDPNTPIGAVSLEEYVEFMCDEAQLPNINTATGSINGLYTGLGNIDYPHTKVFTELQLGFMLDADLTMLKYLNYWYNYIFDEGGGTGEDRVTRVKYRNQYAATIKITKTETGPTSSTQRQPITYVLEQAYPYAIDAIPLQFGSAQITKVTAQFKYQRHYIINKDTTNVKDSQIPAGGRLVGSREISKGVIEQEWLLPNGKIIKKQVSTSDVLDYVPPAPPTVPATPKKPEAIERRPGESPREFAQRRSRELQN
jgi:hypothetical protein